MRLVFEISILFPLKSVERLRERGRDSGRGRGGARRDELFEGVSGVERVGVSEQAQEHWLALVGFDGKQYLLPVHKV